VAFALATMRRKRNAPPHGLWGGALRCLSGSVALLSPRRDDPGHVRCRRQSGWHSD